MCTLEAGLDEIEGMDDAGAVGGHEGGSQVLQGEQAGVVAL